LRRCRPPRLQTVSGLAAARRERHVTRLVHDADPIRGRHMTALASLRRIGVIESTLVDTARAPLQGDEGAPDAWLAFEPAVADGLAGLDVGDRVVVLTWLDRASRNTLRVHPRNDRSRPEQRVFTTRNPDRPNPIGLHEATVLAIEG